MNDEQRLLTFSDAINEALHEALAADKQVICYGLGTDDPKRVFGTTANLVERFGRNRVFDMPTSENAMTGVAIGAGLNGIRSVMCHQRVDFFLLAMDQLVNNAAKWHYMFGGQKSVPITIRLIIGRGWGQGPTHSQNLQAWFAHIPGLKVVMPTTSADAKGLLLGSIFDDNPVVFLEHRWLHNMEGDVPAGDFRIPLGKAATLTSGDDVTIVSASYMTVEALHAIESLESMDIGVDLIDMRSINPIDWDCILTSVRHTGRLLALDTGTLTCSVSAEVVARACSACFESLKCAPRRLAPPDVPTPTSRRLTAEYYVQSSDIVVAVCEMLNRHVEKGALPVREGPHDVPGDWFKGPF